MGRVLGHTFPNRTYAPELVGDLLLKTRFIQYDTHKEQGTCVHGSDCARNAQALTGRRGPFPSCRAGVLRVAGMGGVGSGLRL